MYNMSILKKMILFVILFLGVASYSVQAGEGLVTRMLLSDGTIKDTHELKKNSEPDIVAVSPGGTFMLIAQDEELGMFYNDDPGPILLKIT